MVLHIFVSTFRNIPSDTSTFRTTEIKTTNDKGQTYDMSTNIERTTTSDASHVTNSLTSAIENDSRTHPASEISNHATTTTKEMIEPTTCISK